MKKLLLTLVLLAPGLAAAQDNRVPREITFPNDAGTTIHMTAKHTSMCMSTELYLWSTNEGGHLLEGCWTEQDANNIKLRWFDGHNTYIIPKDVLNQIAKVTY